MGRAQYGKTFRSPSRHLLPPLRYCTEQRTVQWIFRWRWKEATGKREWGEDGADLPPRPCSPGHHSLRMVIGSTSWFNFWLMPGASVLSPIAGESKSDLEEALVTIEGVIEELMDEGIPSENIVLSGASQGGVLTIYTALHSKHKLGGFMPIVTWFPLLKVEPPSELPTPVNVNTPILHLNGLSDPIVPLIPAGSRSKAAMEEVFSNYEMKNRIGTHTTTMGPQNILTVRRWLRKNTNINFSTLKNLVGNIPGLGSLGFGK